VVDDDAGAVSRVNCAGVGGESASSPVGPCNHNLAIMFSIEPTRATTPAASPV
jgi:hypothetical protein